MADATTACRGSTPIFDDNGSCIAWTEVSVGGSDLVKNIFLRDHFVHHAVQDGVLTLNVASNAENVADVLTKPLPEASF